MIKGNIDNGYIDDFDERGEHYGESNNAFIHIYLKGPRGQGFQDSSVI